MRCAICTQTDTPHVVYEHAERRLAGKRVAFWDNLGARHIHDATQTITPLMCSNKHTWEHVGRQACPTCGVPVDPV